MLTWPGTTPRAHLDKHGLQVMQIVPAGERDTFPPFCKDPGHPWVRRVIESITEAAGILPTSFPVAPIWPIGVFQKTLDVPAR